jgi:hypothetical protein
VLEMSWFIQCELQYLNSANVWLHNQHKLKHVFIKELGVMSVIVHSKHSVQHQSNYTLYILFERSNEFLPDVDSLILTFCDWRNVSWHVSVPWRKWLMMQWNSQKL